MRREAQRRLAAKAQVFWPAAVMLLLADCSTKHLVVSRLTDDDPPYQVLGNIVRVGLAYNPGAAMNLSLGSSSRWLLSLLAIVVVMVLVRVYRRLRPDDTGMALALACICGGATGNLLDRIRSSRGVVDFIDIGIGTWRFYTFNIADVGVTLGMTALILLLWRRDRDIALRTSSEPA